MCTLYISMKLLHRQRLALSILIVITDALRFNYPQNNAHSKSFGVLCFRLWKQPQTLLQSTLTATQTDQIKKKD